MKIVIDNSVFMVDDTVDFYQHEIEINTAINEKYKLVNTLVIGDGVCYAKSKKRLYKGTYPLLKELTIAELKSVIAYFDFEDEYPIGLYHIMLKLAKFEKL